MATVNEYVRIFGGKTTVILQQEPPKQFTIAKDKENKQLVVRKQFRGRWRVIEGLNFVKSMFPRTQKSQELFLSNNKVKHLLFYAKTHPGVLEIAFLESKATPVSNDMQAGNAVEEQPSQSNEGGSCDAAPTGAVQPQ